MSAERDLADFSDLRAAAVLTLLDEEEGDGVDLDALRGSLARSEWSRVDPDRRFWALGHCASEAADFDEAREIVHLGWSQLPTDVRQAMQRNVLDWIRASVNRAKAEAPPAQEEEEWEPTETQDASEGTDPDGWAVETKSM